MPNDIPFPVMRGTADGFTEPGAADLPRLFHQLNTQLGIILANAELLEDKLGGVDSANRARHIVSSAVDAIATARSISSHVTLSAESK